MYIRGLKGICIVFILQLFLSVGLSKADDILQCAYDPAYLTLQNQNNNTNVWHRNQDIYISPYELNLKKDRFTIIDVRTHSQFNSFHLAGSYNIPKLKLVTSTIFKDKNIVLIDKGDNYKFIEDLVGKLHQKKYKSVLILDGGIDFWKSHVLGMPLTLSEYNLSNIDKLLSGDMSNWLIVDSTQSTQLSNFFSNLLSIQNDNILNPKTFSKSLFSSKKMIRNVLLVLDPKEDFEKVHHIWNQNFNYNIYTIEVPKMLFATNDLVEKKRVVSHRKRLDGAKMTCLK